METTAIQNISPQSVNRWVAEEKPFILIDTLTIDHFKAIHLPGASHAWQTKNGGENPRHSCFI